ncbi:MAG: Hsp70 family protein [Gammaproteobacteria bacterium]|nr:Hsp70 family protein [Gammaproteobacteria bacterium]
MNQSPRYSVGIDLGTTHCVLSYVDLHSDSDNIEPQILTIPQLTAAGSVEEKNQLPSFLYQAHEAELAPGQMALPWSADNQIVVGTLARNLGSKTPIRLVASAKSWLGHGGVDRHNAFLPLNSPDEVTKVSPVTASKYYLEHLAAAWLQAFPQMPLTEQDVTITVPASFDPGARELTAAAATEVGFEHLTLLEEPQAAVYSWLKNNEDNWREQVSVGDVILVIDVGGGTTDLSLIAVTEQDGNLTLNRVAVGDHILLGGDNMDLALAYTLRAKLAQQGKNLQPWQIQGMVHACRDAKEALLNDSDLQSVPIVVPSRGSKLLGSTLKTELTQQEVQQVLVEGFFPKTPVTEHPVAQARTALTQIGLPYAQDAAISRHLAAFLNRQHDAVTELFGESEDDFIKPTAILFNGGVLKSDLLSSRLMAIINGWLTDADANEAKLLTGVDLDLAVASGASYYGYVRHGKGVRIRGGIASAYYVGIESAMPAIPGMAPPLEAICVAPFGMEEGSSTQVTDRQFGVVVGQPVQFKFFGSTVRRDDEVGTHLDFWAPDELEELPEISATLPIEGRNAGDVVPVTLAARVTEVGTLALEVIARDGDERWQVEFDVRAK